MPTNSRPASEIPSMLTPKQTVLGGIFGLQSTTAGKIGAVRKPPFANSPLTYFLSARCAIYSLCCTLKVQKSWLPSYLCPAVIEPFKKLGVAVRFYDSDPEKDAPDARLAKSVGPSDLVLAIHYFGFANRTFPAKDVANRGAIIVEDASQALFIAQQYPESFCTVYSPRKFLGVPDGGVLAYSPGVPFMSQPLSSPPEDWSSKALAAAEMRRDFDLQLVAENRWFALFREVEESFPVGLYGCSDVTRNLIDTGTDYDHIRCTRRANYRELSTRLEEFALFPWLDDDTVPLGFPVRVRAEVRQTVLESLYAKHIYPAVHWDLHGAVPAVHQSSHLLSKSILTLICDQRYTTYDMARQADAFLSAIA